MIVLYIWSLIQYHRKINKNQETNIDHKKKNTSFIQSVINNYKWLRNSSKKNKIIIHENQIHKLVIKIIVLSIINHKNQKNLIKNQSN